MQDKFLVKYFTMDILINEVNKQGFFGREGREQAS